MKLTKIKMAQGRLPEKRSINLATVDEQKISIPASFGGIALIILVAILFSKFLVFDRLTELSRYQNEVANLQTQVEQCYARLEELVGVENEYAHYTLEAMTDEELTRCDRVAIVEMMQEKVLGNYGAIGWSVSGNRLTVEISGQSLQDINLISQEIEKSPIVDFCTVSWAKKGADNKSIGSDGSITYAEEASVTANINVYLQKGDLFSEETATDNTTGE